MRYKPSRDIPIAVRELRTLSPTKIREWVKTHRTEKTKRGKTQQADITPEAVTMWLKRHKKLMEKLQAEIVEEELPKDAITEDIFQTDVFLQIPCIEHWVLKLGGRGAKERAIKHFIGAIRQVCKGELRRGITIEGWGIKHPRQIDLETALRYISEMQKRNLPTRAHRLALRNFLKSRNIRDWDTISGKLEESAGQYAHLKAPKEKIYVIFDFLKRINEDYYLASKFSFKTASRWTATLEADAKYMNMEDHMITIFEKAKRGSPKRRLEKFIPQDLWDELPKQGKLFNIKDPSHFRDTLREAFALIIPDLAKEIPMPFHFWRHQFAQHMLKETDWNYALVARLGHWTIETLERYYGRMDRKTALEGAKKYVHNI